MRFMMLVKGPESAGYPPKALMDAIDQQTGDAIKDGSFITAGGLGATKDGARIRIVKGKVVVTDGPFTETKEILGGFAIFELPSREVAIASAKQFMELHVKYWPGWEGETEVRQMMDGPPGEPPA
jgi:hypothetical protein